MKLSVREQTDILKGFPKFELSYEKRLHKKVQTDIYLTKTMLVTCVALVTGGRHRPGGLLLMKAASAADITEVSDSGRTSSTSERAHVQGHRKIRQ